MCGKSTCGRRRYLDKEDYGICAFFQLFSESFCFARTVDPRKIEGMGKATCLHIYVAKGMPI